MKLSVGQTSFSTLFDSLDQCAIQGQWVLLDNLRALNKAELLLLLKKINQLYCVQPTVVSASA